MTREEAITLIKAALKTMYLPKSKEYVSDLGYALEIAIKALEQEPCEDAINREDALMCLTGEIKDTDTIETIIARFARRIRKLTPVNPQNCDNCEVGNPCIYCKHEFEPQEGSGEE